MNVTLVSAMMAGLLYGIKDILKDSTDAPWSPVKNVWATLTFAAITVTVGLWTGEVAAATHDEQVLLGLWTSCGIVASGALALAGPFALVRKVPHRRWLGGSVVGADWHTNDWLVSWREVLTAND